MRNAVTATHNKNTKSQGDNVSFPRAVLRHLSKPKVERSVRNPDVREAGDTRESAYSLFHHWLSFAGLLLFGACLLWQHQVWTALAGADPTGITLIIIAVFGSSTLWCGFRSYRLCAEAEVLAAWRSGSRRIDPGSAVGGFLSSLLPAAAAKTEPLKTPLRLQADILAERLHGPSESAWWINGIQIKLGLLGKVIGFSILALQIARIDNFDPAQSQTLLRSLTGGLGIALLTTAVGLVGNILLGLQLMRIDRYADRLLADTLACAGGEQAGPVPAGPAR